MHGIHVNAAYPSNEVVEKQKQRMNPRSEAPRKTQFDIIVPSEPYRSRAHNSVWREPTKKHAARGNAGTAHQPNAETSNWIGHVLPAKLSGTLAKGYFGGKG
jgi:hypothetical protein